MTAPNRLLSGLGRLLAALVLAGFAAPSIAADAEPAGRPVATIQKDGKKVVIDVMMSVPVAPAIVWEVMTDFNNMARYLPNLSSSEAVIEGPNLLRVKQKGTARWGPFGVDFETERRIALQPFSRIEATALTGKISKMHSVSEITAAEGSTRIQYHADAEVDFWLPPGLGTRAMRTETEEQFSAMATEMLRRAGVPTARP